MASLPKLYRLSEAAELLGAGVGVAALRTAARRGHLEVVRLAGKMYVTEAALTAMVTAATVPARGPCRDADCQLDSISGEAEMTDPASGSFSMDRRKLALEQALASLEKLKRPLPITLPKTTEPRVVPIGRRNSSLQK
jgi:hypothetical protein